MRLGTKEVLQGKGDAQQLHSKVGVTLTQSKTADILLANNDQPEKVWAREHALS